MQLNRRFLPFSQAWLIEGRHIALWSRSRGLKSQSGHAFRFSGAFLFAGFCRAQWGRVVGSPGSHFGHTPSHSGHAVFLHCNLGEYSRWPHVACRRNLIAQQIKANIGREAFC